MTAEYKYKDNDKDKDNENDKDNYKDNDNYRDKDILSIILFPRWLQSTFKWRLKWPNYVIIRWPVSLSFLSFHDWKVVRFFFFPSLFILFVFSSLFELFFFVKSFLERSISFSQIPAANSLNDINNFLNYIWFPTQIPKKNDIHNSKNYIWYWIDWINDIWYNICRPNCKNSCRRGSRLKPVKMRQTLPSFNPKRYWNRFKLEV